MRSGWRSASVTASTAPCCKRSYTQADPCRPAPRTSIRMMQQNSGWKSATSESSGRKGSEGAGTLEARGSAAAPLDSPAMRQADLTRQRLGRAALGLFTTQGYHDTTTPQLAKRAGIAEGTIYRHFTSKQHLLNELYRAAARWATQHVREAEAAGGSLPGRLGKLGESVM